MNKDKRGEKVTMDRWPIMADLSLSRQIEVVRILGARSNDSITSALPEEVLLECFEYLISVCLLFLRYSLYL